MRVRLSAWESPASISEEKRSDTWSRTCPHGSTPSGAGDNRGTMRKIGESSRLLNRCAASGQGQNRTADTRIFSPLLYQLSYLAEGREKSSATTTSASGSVNGLLTPPADSGTYSGTR